LPSAPGTFSEPTFTAHAGKNLGACQVLIIREQQDDPTSSTRFFATSRLKDTLEQVVDTAAKRWTVETLFADFKELMGSDQYQLHSAEAIQRFWALALCLYIIKQFRHLHSVSISCYDQLNAYRNCSF